MENGKITRAGNLPPVPNVCGQILREVWKKCGISIAYVIMRPAEASLKHKHEGFTEVYYILKGTGTIWVGKEPFIVGETDLAEIPPGTPHCLLNTGTGRLEHLVISVPAFDPDDVILLEER